MTAAARLHGPTAAHSLRELVRTHASAAEQARTLTATDRRGHVGHGPDDAA